MCRLRRVHPDTRFRRRNQARIQQRFVICVLQRFLLLFIRFQMLSGFELFAQGIGGVHAGALAVCRVEPGKCKPCFVPQEYKVGLDRQTFLHHPLDVIHKPVKGTVGQQQHADLIQFARGFKRQ